MKRLFCISAFLSALAVLGVLTACSDNSLPTPYTLSNSPRTQGKNAKRGVSFAFQVPDEDMALLGPSITWFYNWAPDCGAEVQAAAEKYGVKFFPMAWNGDFSEDRITAMTGSSICGDYLLAFNEPNLTDQCNYTPAQAAREWPRLRALATRLGLKLTSPAMNYGTLNGYHNPLTWLDEFFSLVPLSDVDAIALHCYMGSAASMKNYIDMFDKYGKPIWLTEFCGWDTNVNSVAAQLKFLSESLAYLDACPKVERYAWFIPRSADATDAYPYMQLLTKSGAIALTDVGKAFTLCSTQDTSVYALAGQRIEAEHYVRCNASDGIGSGRDFSAAPLYRPTADPDGGNPDGGNLDIHSIGIGKWVEYQVEMATDTARMLLLRHDALVDSKVEVAVDGLPQDTLDIAAGGWATAQSAISMKQGLHKLRLTTIKGSWAANWLMIQ